MIEVIKKAMLIMDCFANSDNPVMGNNEISEKLGFSPSTTHNIIRTLCDEGLLIRTAQRKYRLGWKVLEWANYVMFQRDIYAKALPIVSELSHKYDGIVHIGMYDKGTVVFVLKFSPHDSQLLQTYVGSRKPAYSTSAGKVLLAYNKKYFDDISKLGMEKQGPNTITNLKDLYDELALIKERRYAISNLENDTLSYAIAAPIFSYNNRVMAALNFVSFNERIIMEREIIERVKDIARSISKELGFISLSETH